MSASASDEQDAHGLAVLLSATKTDGHIHNTRDLGVKMGEVDIYSRRKRQKAIIAANKMTR